MASAEQASESALALARALLAGARRLLEAEPLQALGMAELAAALAGSCGDERVRRRAALLAVTCRSRLLERGSGEAVPA